MSNSMHKQKKAIKVTTLADVMAHPKPKPEKKEVKTKKNKHKKLL